MTSGGASETRPVSSPVSPFNAGAFAPGTILADRYRIVALAGRGGMGEVYRAEDLRLGQTVALKFLPAGLEHDPEARERLAAEVRNARTIAHPNVCRVYDIGGMQGRSFLTMEYIDGEDLASLLRRIGRLPAAKALEVARQLCAGLSSAHDKGVLHRDLKPANVMIDGRGQARITDFGLAVEAGPSTSPADLAGTLGYMAPERFHGAPATVQSDLYALGLIMYEICTGSPAVKGTTLNDWEQAHADSTPARPSSLVSEIEPAVERVILRCLEKDPVRRPGSAALVGAALPGGDPLAAAVAAGETPSPELVAASGEEGTLPRRQAWLWLAASALGFAALMWMMPWWSLASRVTLPHPELQKARARQILRDVGYGDRPADAAWWMRQNAEYLAHFRDMDTTGRALDAAVAGPSAVVFCYRQSPTSLANFSGIVSADDPSPVTAADAYLELRADGRLMELRVVPERRDAPSASRASFDWSRLLAAARVDAARLTPVAPEWGPVYAFDSRAAWEGVLDDEPVRVEAAAMQGKATYFRLSPAWMPQAGSAAAAAPVARTFLAWFNPFLSIASVGFLAALAARNLRLGRGDRRSALRLAAFMGAMLALGDVLGRHWTATSSLPAAGGAFERDPVTIGPMQQILGTMAQPLFLALAVWLAYVGFEPLVRRRWPHLLIASTRLLDGRWRDPLVGRSLLTGIAGVLAAMILAFACIAAARLAGWGTVIPQFRGGTLDGLAPFVGYVARNITLNGMVGVIYLAVLVLAQFILRGAAPPWTGLIPVCLVMFVSWGRVFLGPSHAVVGLFAITLTAVSVVTLWKGGLLALAVWVVALVLLRDTPWTPALTQWYAWPTWFSATLIAGLLVWGFRNVLGRQSAFSSES